MGAATDNARAVRAATRQGIPTAVLIAGLLVAPLPRADAQGTVATADSAAKQQHYFSFSGLPGSLQDYYRALGNELRPGSERTVLTGTLTTPDGTVPFTFTRELDQNARMDIGGTKPAAVVASGLLGDPSVTTGASETEDAIMETLTDDSPESFIYGVVDGASYRRIGGRFRTDDGTTPDYSGPFYDLYWRVSRVSALPGKPLREKLVFFDSLTQLFANSRYSAVRLDGTAVQVEVSYDNWTKVDGRPVPGTISRTENGRQVFSIRVTSVASATSAADGLFTARQ